MMMYKYYEFEYEIILNDKNFINIYLSNPKFLRTYIFDFFAYDINEKHSFFDGNKSYNFNKIAMYLSDIFSLNCNSKKIINQIYDDILMNNNADRSDLVVKINELLMKFINELQINIDCSIEYKNQVSQKDILELLNVRPLIEVGEIFTQFYKSLILFSKVLSIRYFFIQNIDNYFTLDELKILKEICIDNEICIINISSSKKSNTLFDECIVIDNINCQY